MPRKIANPYASVSTLKVPELNKSDLDALVKDPDTFFANSDNRAKLFGMDASKLKQTLSEYRIREGIDAAAMLKTVITDIDI